MELVRQVSTCVGDETALVTAVPDLTLYRHIGPSTPDAVAYEPSLAVVVQGRKRVDLGDATFVYDQSQFLLTSLDLPVTSQVVEASPASPYLCMRLRIQIPMVRELLGHGECHDESQPLDVPAMVTGTSTPELLDAFRRLLDLAACPQDAPYLGGLVVREILYRILKTPEGRCLRAIATLGDHSERTAKAVDWIKENYDEPLRVNDLARMAGMGVSTLHRHFRALTALSPLQYQKQLRLHAARRRMLMEGLDAASAAYAVGYESPSQFNREYARFFGQPPMRDVRTHLSSGPGAPHSVDTADVAASE
ncbi:AraC family transcriptional regulator [Paraburkholderia sp.]|uniref:AraC family transcriptional regulator n=1 Tax=Paraburkholderia sp. TaxID=1926495 RepID=UPI00238C7991|nr:AraC family transcriptional regulator [Paraburkholderia sp.]MDE1180941.1 AraC family transcriptional regulator [Paraburkholderia sp.]